MFAWRKQDGFQALGKLFFKNVLKSFEFRVFELIDFTGEKFRLPFSTRWRGRRLG
jgi:hypothetical protein